MESYLKELNAEQLSAATETEGYIRVIAGAGSGKTKTLTSRYLYLIEELGISTANILCVTFTNKAALEMKKRIRRQLPDGADAQRRQRPRGGAADEEQIRDRQRPDPFPEIVPVEYRDGVRLFVVGAELCEGLVPADADAHRDADLFLHPPPDLLPAVPL